MKKILSIDGGGIRGIIPAIILDRIEEETDTPTAKNFDFIAGTSTGGILALGLTMRDKEDREKPAHTAKELANIYRSRGREIFDRSSLEDALADMSSNLRPEIGKWFSKAQDILSVRKSLFDEKYSHEGLTKVLNCNFQSALLSDAIQNTMVTCYDIQGREPLLLKSWADEHANVKIADAARATSAAPTYFEPHYFSIGSDEQTSDEHTLIDGGVYLNSPVVSAYAEAKNMFQEEKDFFVLSLGTGELTREIRYKDAKNWGIAEWSLPLLYCIFDGVSKIANEQMNAILGSDNYIRLQCPLNKGMGNDDLDDVRRQNIDRLEDRADALINSDEFDRVVAVLQEEDPSE